MKRITIGTRASKLAMIQTGWVVERLHQHWPNLEIAIEHIHTTGDRVTNVPLMQIGSDGVFVKEIERALAERRIDLAVHSLKDLPTAQPAGFLLAVAGPREDVRDVLVFGSAMGMVEEEVHPDTFGKLRDIYGPTPRIGTVSLRRGAQLRALCPGLQLLPLRGNVDTRLRKLEADDYDGIVLAAAGLHRLEMREHLNGRFSYFPVEMMLPAPGQGALGLEVRDEPEMRALLAPLNDPEIQATTSAERMFMRRLGAGCYLPVAAYADITGDTLTLRGLITSLDGEQQIRLRQSIAWLVGTSVEYAEQFGVDVAEQALRQGAEDIIRGIDLNREQERQHV